MPCRCQEAMTDFSQIIICPVCAQKHQGANIDEKATVKCARCGSVIFEETSGSLGRALAFSLGALILYFPANMYPILSVTRMGVYSESTIWQGVRSLFTSGYWGVAILVFLASIIIPLIKLVVMIYLVASTNRDGHERIKYLLLRIIRFIGPWSMLDVFLVAILVALVKLKDLATIRPEPGLIAFAGVVVLTIMASESFEARSLWQGEEKE